MQVEQVENGLLIKTTEAVDMNMVQKIIDYYNVLEIVSKAKGTEEEATQLAEQVDKNWWQSNKHRFIK